jgi:hypothetical protein
LVNAVHGPELYQQNGLSPNGNFDTEISAGQPGEKRLPGALIAAGWNLIHTALSPDCNLVSGGACLLS